MEKSSEEDIIRFDIAGTEQVTIQDGKIEPTTDNDIDLGASGKEFKDLHIDGTANIDTLVADTADINAGTFDGVVGGTIPAAGTFTALEGNTTLKVGTTNQGDILYDNNTSIVRLTPGTAGDILKTGGAAANPSWLTILPLANGGSGTTGDAIAKGWINFNGTSGDFGSATRDSFNVSSITDGGVGIYNINWDTDFADGKYAAVATCVGVHARYSSTGTYLTTKLRIICEAHDGVVTDSTLLVVVAFGDQ